MPPFRDINPGVNCEQIGRLPIQWNGLYTQFPLSTSAVTRTLRRFFPPEASLHQFRN